MIDDLGYTDDGITHASARFGYMDQPNVPDVLRLIEKAQIESPIEVDDASSPPSSCVAARRPG